MATTLSVKAVVDDVTKGFEDAGVNVPKVMQMALNQTGRKARTRTRKKLREIIRPRRGRAKKVNEKVVLIPSTVSSRVATIRVKRLAIGVENVAATRLQVNKRGKRERLTVKYEGNKIPHSFRTPRLGNGTAIFRRTKRARARKSRLPIKRVFAYGPVQQIEKRDLFAAEIEQPTLEDFEKNFTRLFNLKLDKIKLKGSKGP